MKRVLLPLVFALFSTLLWAQWNGSTATAPAQSGGAYQITSAENLAWVAQQSKSNSFAGVRFVLTQDIDLNHKQWTPIGNASYPFQGQFDGGCHAINNFYYFAEAKAENVGLFGVIGNNGRVANVAMGIKAADAATAVNGNYNNGMLLADDAQNAGIIAGINRGTVTHVINLMGLNSFGAGNIGTLIGTNEGTLEYSYNVGVLSAGSATAGGGLVGDNSKGTIRMCYNVGYANPSDPITGKKGTVQNAYFDRQVTTLLTGGGGTALTQKNLATIFAGDNEWISDNDKLYPQLACFNSTSQALSEASVMPVFPAGTQSADQSQKGITSDFTVGQVDSEFEWSVRETVVDENDTIIVIDGTKAKYNKPCGLQQVNLIATVGEQHKFVRIFVQGYYDFITGAFGKKFKKNAEVTYDTVRVCEGVEKKFSELSVTNEAAQQGKDDGKTDEEKYWYKYEYYDGTKVKNGVIPASLKPLQADEVPQAKFSAYTISTENTGLIFITRAARDSRCRPDWSPSVEVAKASGTAKVIDDENFGSNGVYVYITAKLDSGSIKAVEQVIYQELPYSVTISNNKAAAGGTQPYAYSWFVSNSSDKKGTAIKTDDPTQSSLTTTVGKANDRGAEYYITRWVADSECQEEPIQSGNVVHYTVYDILKAGSLWNTKTNPKADSTITLCNPQTNLTVPFAGATAVTGATGNYEYHWYLDGKLVADQTGATVNITNLGLSFGKTYKLTREVCDTQIMSIIGKSGNECKTTTGTLTIKVNSEFSAGAITVGDSILYGEESYTKTIANKTLPSGGSGKFNFTWMYSADANIGAGDKQASDYSTDINQSALTVTITADNDGTEYWFYRTVGDESCNDAGLFSTGVQHFMAYRKFSAGSIEEQTLNVCEPSESKTLKSTAAATGANGKYEYRWKLDGKVVEGLTGAQADLNQFGLDYGKDYTITREARFTGLPANKTAGDAEKWFVSEGTVKIHVFNEFDAGTISVNRQDTIVFVGINDACAQRSILSYKEATGGSQPYTYTWMVSTDANIGAGDKKASDYSDKIDDTRITLCLTAADYGSEYWFYRTVADANCHTTPVLSEGVQHYIVYNELRPGEIESLTGEYELFLCDPKVNRQISEFTPATGIDGKYQYRWILAERGAQTGTVVPGATNNTVNVQDLPLTYNRQYTLYREVKHELTDWKRSNGRVDITVYEKVDYGSIKTGSEAFCFETKEDSIILTIEQTKAPEGSGEMPIRWVLRDENSAWSYTLPNSNVNQLDRYVIKWSQIQNLTLPASLTMRREVKSNVCENQWIASDGTYSIRLGMTEHKTQTIKVCEKNLPETLTFTYNDGTTTNYTFNANGDVVTLREMLPSGCERETKLTCRAVVVPEVEFEELGQICQNSNILTLNYNVTRGTATNFEITFDDDVKAAYEVQDTTGVLESQSGKIEVFIPALGDDDFALNVVFTNENEKSIICAPNEYKVPFTIAIDGFIEQRWNDVLFVNNNSTHWPSTAGLTDSLFVSYQWYKDGYPLEGETGQTYQEIGGLNGTYSVQLTTNGGLTFRTCEVIIDPSTGLEELGIDPASVVRTDYFTVMGQQLSRMPLSGGVYIIRYTLDNGKMITSKVFVK
ncbi:MAG: hypothetical protein IJS73_00525 [Paludibacteraceae bacterium]|nr:hypothetical protein [Paludibacteraceae bacterium]